MIHDCIRLVGGSTHGASSSTVADNDILRGTIQIAYFHEFSKKACLELIGRKLLSTSNTIPAPRSGFLSSQFLIPLYPGWWGFIQQRGDPSQPRTFPSKNIVLSSVSCTVLLASWGCDSIFFRTRFPSLLLIRWTRCPTPRCSYVVPKRGCAIHIATLI